MCSRDGSVGQCRAGRWCIAILGQDNSVELCSALKFEVETVKTTVKCYSAICSIAAVTVTVLSSIEPHSAADGHIRVESLGSFLSTFPPDYRPPAAAS